MSKNTKLVWSDDGGDQRKSKKMTQPDVNKNDLLLQIRRLTSGKGRVVIELRGLPNNKKWCENLAKGLKKALGVGGTYKNGYIEVHGEKLEAVTAYLDQEQLPWKKTGG